jgi:hypothetical protein
VRTAKVGIVKLRKRFCLFAAIMLIGAFAFHTASAASARTHHILLEVKFAGLVRELGESLVDLARVELRRARIGYTGLGVKGDIVQVTIRDPAEVETAKKLLSGIAVSVETDPMLPQRLVLRTDESEFPAVREASIRSTMADIEIRFRCELERDSGDPGQVEVRRHKGTNKIELTYPADFKFWNSSMCIHRAYYRHLRIHKVLAEYEKAPDQSETQLARGEQILESDPAYGLREGLRLLVQRKVLLSREHVLEARLLPALFRDPDIELDVGFIGRRRMVAGERIALVNGARVMATGVVQEADQVGRLVFRMDASREDTERLVERLRTNFSPTDVEIVREWDEPAEAPGR